MLKIINATKSFGQTKILDGINFEIADNEIVAIVGPNGCGKSTLLKIIAGLEKLDNGEIKTSKAGDEEIKTSLIFQDHRASLFPWKTIRGNIEFAITKMSNQDKKEKVDQILSKLNLAKHQNKFPYQLSGGMSQLVAFGRAIAQDPDIFLFDEPFSAMDYHAGLKLQQQFIDLMSLLQKPACIVTHSFDEAIFLADKIIILSTPPTKVIQILENNLEKPRKIEMLGNAQAQEIKEVLFSNINSFLS
ncbi:MAG: ABC transporter ATP-binding protein [Candidatus Magasanikbacteria bacterium]